MSKYKTLLNILDGLNLEAPAEYKSYHPNKSDQNAVDQSRSKSFLHLF